MRKLLCACIGVVAALASGPFSSFAASTTTNLPVSATLVAGCAVSATGINFGSVPSGATIQQQDATGIVTVTCGLGAPYTVYMGAGTAAAIPTRGMRSVSNPNGVTMRYNLYQDSSHLVIWGDAGGGDTFPAGTGLQLFGSGQADNLTVYGRILQDTTPPTVTGDYTDTVLVTLVF